MCSVATLIHQSTAITAPTPIAAVRTRQSGVQPWYQSSQDGKCAFAACTATVPTSTASAASVSCSVAVSASTRSRVWVTACGRSRLSRSTRPPAWTSRRLAAGSMKWATL